MRNRTPCQQAAIACAAVALLAGCETLTPGDGAKSAAPAAAASAAAQAATLTAGTSPFTLSTPTPAPGASTTPAAAPAPGARPGGLPGSTPATPPTGPPPFATVIKDARRFEGPLTLWQKDEKVWIELLPDQFGKPFLFSPKIKSGIGEAFILGGLLSLPVNGAGGMQLVEFQRVHSQVRLQARNTEVVAKPGTPEARALADTYSPSLLGAVAVASQPHPDRKSVLIEANGLFLSDLLGVGMMLQRSLRQGYGLDRANSVITAVRVTDQAVTLETQSHFYSGSVAMPMPGAPPGVPVPLAPRFLPDTRSMLVSLNLSLAPLPDKPMATREADPRVGLFATSVLDFSDELTPSPRRRLVNRWRLEKKDPAAPMSDAVKPIAFWIDRNVPLVYREAVRAGILEWNKAFEKVGISNAITVEQQADDAKFDTLDYGRASVRWMLSADAAFGAIGLIHTDPRSGEILEAGIGFEGLQTRSVRTLRTQFVAQAAGATGTADAPVSFATPFAAPSGMPMPAELMRCQQGTLAAEQLGYALDVMMAGGELEPDSPIAQQFVQDFVKQNIMHEVGHTLGLRHNFRASRAYTEAQLADPEFTRAHGTSGSVMEYNAVNLPLPGKTGGMPFHTALGPYDYWAIEYAYKPLAAGILPEQERAELQRIAARSNEPLLAFGTDEDAWFGIDPETLQLDLGADPVAFASKRLAIARELFRRQETRELSPQRDYAVLRRSISYAVADVTRAVSVLVRQIGGVRTLRDFPGSGRDPLLPVATPVQREALNVISRAVLSPDGLSLSPALQRRLAPDYLDRAEFGAGTDYSLAQRLLELQRGVLAYLMSDGIASRVLDSVGKVDRPADAFQLAELYQRLQDDVWSELGRAGGAGAGVAGAITAPRRDLQRDHVNRLAAAVLRPAALSRADARGLVRTQARALLVRLDAAQRARGATADADTRAHLVDATETLRQAFAATLQRQSL